MPTQPYVPNSTPSQGDVGELERYVREEYERISLAIRSTTVQAAYAGLAITTPRTGTVDIEPVILEGFDDFYPARPSRIISNPVIISPPLEALTVLTVLEAGMYNFSCQINVEITPGATFNLTLRKNAEITPVFGTWDTSNQTDQVWLNFGAMTTAAPGDVFSVWGNADADGEQFDIQSGNFQVYRVSEILDIDSL